MATGFQPFTYFAYDFLTGHLLGSLPLRGVTFGSTLNTPGQFQANLDLTDPRIQAAGAIGLTTPQKTFLVVDYLGSIVWAGLVQTRRWDVSGSKSGTSYSFQIQASEPWCYFQQRVQATDYSAPPYSGIYPNPTTMPIWDAASSGSTWDPMLIAGQIISDALSYSQNVTIPNGNPLGGIGLLYNFKSVAAYLAGSSATPSADYINITYPFTTLQTIDTIVTQLSQLGYGVGFDFAVDTAYSGVPSSAPVATVNLSYPRRGRTVASNSLVIDLTRARSYSFPEDGTSMADTVFETGGSGAIDASTNVFPLKAGYAAFEKVFSRGQLTSANIMALLAQTAYTDLYQSSWPPVTPQVVLDLFGPTLPVGSFITGDDVELQLPSTDQTGGAVFDPRFPAGLSQEWRITEWQAKVADDGDSTLTLTLNQPPVLLPAAPAI